MYTLLRHLNKQRRRLSADRPRPPRTSLALRHVDAGSCNGCEHELNAVANPYYDLQQYGLSIVASPRHADVLLVTGPVTTRMATALRTAYDAMPEPRLVAAIGDCALTCGLFLASDDVAGPVDNILPVDIRIPGCPPTPSQIAEHLLAYLQHSTTNPRSRT